MGNGFNATEGFMSFMMDHGSTRRPEMGPVESGWPISGSGTTEKELPKKEITPFLGSFLTEMIPCIKNQLGAIRNLTHLPADRFEDVESRKTLQRGVAEKIRQIDSVLNSLLNYININTPVIKANTLRLILEEVLEANVNQLREKNIKIFKRSERDLPETFVHDEQVKFILNAVLQYAILSSPIDGTIGFLFRTFDPEYRESDKKASIEENGAYIEAVVGFTGHSIPTEPRETTPPSNPAQKEKVIDLILSLVEEILEKNRGMMKWEVDEKGQALIILRFPIERRKVVYYERINI